MTARPLVAALFILALLPAARAVPPSPTQPPAQVQTAKPRISKLDDLPRHSYPVQGNVEDLLTSAPKFNDLADKIRANTEKDLADYDIQDKTLLKSLKGTLTLLDLLQDKNDDARKLLTELKGLEDKQSLKLMSGLVAMTRLDVSDRLQSTDYASAAYQKAFQDELTQRVKALPYSVVQDELKEMRAGAQIRSKNLIMGSLQSEIEPAVKKTGVLTDEMADTIAAMRASLLFSIPLKGPTAAALTAVINANNVQKPDVWGARAVTLSPDTMKITPTVIGIWDSGVDPTVYPHQLFVDPTSKIDPNGIAFDLHSNPVHGDLYPLGTNSARVPELRALIKGELDMEAGVDSADANALRAKMSTLAPNDVKPFFEDLEIYGNYIHGTHVAGIASNGNPAARLLIARITFDYHVIPEKPTIAQAERDVASYKTTIAYFKAHHVRVVNMSWGGSLKDVEDALVKNGVADATARKKEARVIFDIGRNGLFDALKSAPEILFVTAAGNSDNDVNFDEVVPSSFVLPNMMTIGAVDQAGDETSFTSFGKNVAAYADGFEVPSPIPGGTILKLSGTSMASPEVTNLAAKLFALDPGLSPAEVIDLIHSGLEVSKDNPHIQLVDPKKTIALLQAKLQPHA